MYFVLKMKKNLQMKPDELCRDMETALTNKLAHTVIGTCSGRYGFVVSITEVPGIDSLKGQVVHGTGNVEYVVNFTACVFRPFVGETLDGIVKSVNKMGIFVIVSALEIFVSRHLMSPDMKFDKHSNPAAYVSGMMDERVRIEPGSEVRIRIVGIRFDAREIFAIASLKEDYLGVSQQPGIDGAPLVSMGAVSPVEVEVGA